MQQTKPVSKQSEQEVRKMNEVGRTVYTISGTTLENDKRKTAAKEALAAIKNELPENCFTCEIIKDILELAKDIAYTTTLH